ncbi:hypothetical protein WDU94_015393 [Cyamophila willieti]
MTCEGCEISIVDFSMFKNKTELRNLLINHGVIKDTISCPKCTQPVNLNKKIMSFKCQKSIQIGDTRKKCNYSVSPLTGTFLSYAKLDLVKLIHFICYLLFFNPPRQSYYANHLKLATQTVVERTSYCREVFVDWMYQYQRNKIGGAGTTVEMDEAKISKRKYNCGRRGKWVVTGICRENKDIFVVPVLIKSKEIILQIIREKILPGTSIISDMWHAGEPQSFLGDPDFKQLKSKHNLKYVVPHKEPYNFNWHEVHSGKPRFGSRKVHREEYIAEYLFKEKYQHLERVHEYLIAAANMFPGMTSPNDIKEMDQREKASRAASKKKKKNTKSM